MTENDFRRYRPKSRVVTRGIKNIFEGLSFIESPPYLIQHGNDHTGTEIGGLQSTIFTNLDVMHPNKLSNVMINYAHTGGSKFSLTKKMVPKSIEDTNDLIVNPPIIRFPIKTRGEVQYDPLEVNEYKPEEYLQKVSEFCIPCVKEFHSESEYLEHLKSHHKRNFKCLTCSVKSKLWFTYKKDLEEHERGTHPCLFQQVKTSEFFHSTSQEFQRLGMKLPLKRGLMHLMSMNGLPGGLKKKQK